MNSRRLCSAVLALCATTGVTTAHAEPVSQNCTPTGVCSARLNSVTADPVNGTITGIPIGAHMPITLAGQGDAYLKSSGFGSMPPAPVVDWDDTIDRVSGLDVSPADPHWYGNAKAKVFLPRTLNDLATHFPPGTVLVRFSAAEADGPLPLVSIQPTPR